MDQMGDLGWNPNQYISWDCPTQLSNDVDYDCHFGGTSAACPVVSGVASLLLARDPSLTAERVYYILRQSAVTDLDWGSITPPVDEYGWGRVDAFRAMLAIARGDADNSGAINVGDAVYITTYIFKGGPAPKPDTGTGDANCDGSITVEDVVFLSNYIFKGGPAPGLCFKYDY